MAIPALVPESLSYLDLLAIQEHNMKTCTKCGVTKPISAFSKDSSSKDGKQCKCKQCDAEYRKQNREHRLAYERERYLKNSDDLKAYQKRYKAENPDKVKQRQNIYHLKKRYGLSSQDKQKMLDEQNNKCAVCETEFEQAKATHVDHCHTTNEIRGILCRNCNIGLGHFKDSQELLAKAIGYLGKYERN